MELLHESFFYSFFSLYLCCWPIFTYRKVLILHEQSIDLVKSLNRGAAAHTVLTEPDDHKLFSRGMASIKSTASYVS